MTQDTNKTGIPHQERASTGIEGLDDILDGGLPTHHLSYLSGVTTYRGNLRLLSESRGRAEA